MESKCDKKEKRNGMALCIGEVLFCINLQQNILNCAQFIFENEKTVFPTKYLGVYLREIACFYELFFKYNLLKISKSFVWADAEKYDENRHNNADMKTISYGSVLVHALCLGWVNRNEYNAIIELKNIRNKLVHFSCNEINDKNTKNVSVVKINIDFHISLIKSLLKTHKNLFDSPLYKIIENDYLLDDKGE